MISFAHELTTSATVSDATWASLEEHFDAEQLVELTFIVAMWNMTNRLNNAFGTPLEPDQEPARKLLFGD